MKKRGLTGVRLVISDQHAGLVAAIARSLQGVAHQRCRVHFIRNVLAHVAKGEAEMVAAVFRTIFAQPDAAHVCEQLDTIAGMLGRQLPKVENMLRDAADDVTACADFHGPHRKRSGQPIRWSASIEISNAAPTSWASSPTRPPLCASRFRCSSQPRRIASR